MHLVKEINEGTWLISLALATRLLLTSHDYPKELSPEALSSYKVVSLFDPEFGRATSHMTNPPGVAPHQQSRVLHLLPCNACMGPSRHWSGNCYCRKTRLMPVVHPTPSRSLRHKCKTYLLTFGWSAWFARS